MRAIDKVIDWLERLTTEQRVAVVTALPVALIALFLWVGLTETNDEVPEAITIADTTTDTTDDSDHTVATDTDTDTDTDTGPDLPVSAITECRDAIRDKLNAPSTADFDNYPGRENVSPGRWHLAGMASAQNAFGVEYDFEYACVLTVAPGETVDVVESAIREPQS